MDLLTAFVVVLVVIWLLRTFFGRMRPVGRGRGHEVPLGGPAPGRSRDRWVREQVDSKVRPIFAQHLAADSFSPRNSYEVTLQGSHFGAIDVPTIQRLMGRDYDVFQRPYHEPGGAMEVVIALRQR